MVSNNQKEVVADLKLIYRAGTKKSAELELNNFTEKWENKYPKVTETKGAFPNETALLKLVYLATQRMMEKWKNGKFQKLPKI